MAKKRIKMDVSVFVITIYGEDLQGTAYDMRTLISLLEISEKREGYLGVSLHGKLPNGEILSGIMRTRDAFLMLQRIRV